MKIGSTGPKITVAPLAQYPTLSHQRLVLDNGTPSAELIRYIVSEFRVNLNNKPFSRLLNIITAPEKDFLSALKTRTLAVFDRNLSAGCSRLVEELKESFDRVEFYCEHCAELDSLADGSINLEQLMLSVSSSSRVRDLTQSEKVKELMSKAVTQHQYLIDSLRPVIAKALETAINEITGDPSQFMH